MATAVTHAAAATSNDNIIESLSNKYIQSLSSSSSSPLPYWIELTEKKQFSRLLYTNPVCFLCCNSNSDSTSDNSNDVVTNGDTVRITSGTDATRCDSIESQEKQGSSHNVMVLSWLTATNNNGQFIFSIHRRRHSASLLLNIHNETEAQASLSHPPNPIGNLFTLSVPIEGMEELVLAVGRVSGRHVDKFSSSLSSRPNKSMYNDDKTNDQQQQHQQELSLSKIRKNNFKKSRRYRTEDGPAIPGLKAIPIPLDLSWVSSSSSSSTTWPLCYIDGTVAYMICQVVQILDNNYNDDHYTVLGQIRSAKVLSTYWDIQKNLFRPMNNSGNIDTITTSSDAKVSATEIENTKIRPYLTFFGSQTFGYVVP